MSSTYDDVFRTIVTDCKELLFPVVNEIFQENYTGEEAILLRENEVFLREPGEVEKRITDATFQITSLTGETRHYHLECQSSMDGTILIRLYEYDSQIALKNSRMEGYRLEVEFPHSAVIFLRYTKTLPDRMELTIKTPGGSISYGIPAIKLGSYDIDTIFEKRLYFLIPFHIFAYEKCFDRMEWDEAELQKLREAFTGIRKRLEQACLKGEISDYEKHTIFEMTEKVIEALAGNYSKVREAGKIMGGQVLEYEAKRILNKGIERGIERGQMKMLFELVKKGLLTCEQAANQVEMSIGEFQSALQEYETTCKNFYI